jgi:hypothetical protein
MIKIAKKHIKSGNQELREVQTQIKRAYLFLIS